MIQGSSTGSEYQLLELIDRYGSHSQDRCFALLNVAAFLFSLASLFILERQSSS
jgi:hypothetical protein